MVKLKTLKIKEDTHSGLVELGKKGESFDDVINMLIEFYKKSKK